MAPLAIDLFCGLGGWTEGLLAEGYRVVGFDIERHVYGDAKYPAQLVLQDVLTIHGSQFRDADLIVASPPCQRAVYRKNGGGSWFLDGSSAIQRNDPRDAHLDRAIKGVGIGSVSWGQGKGNRHPNDPRNFYSKSPGRKAASAHIAKIPIVLSRHIARAWKPLSHQDRSHEPHAVQP